MDVTKSKLLILVMLIWTTMASADTFEFSLLPSNANLSAAAGQTVGWGFEVHNTSTTNYLVASSLNSDLFQQGTANAFFLDVVLAPDASITVQYDPLAGTGLYEFTWDTTATLGFINSGTFLLSADFYDSDPFNGGTLVDTGEQNAHYSVTVTADSPVGVPEPATAVLLGVSVVGLLTQYRWQARSQFDTGKRGGKDKRVHLAHTGSEKLNPELSPSQSRGSE
jgi:hypothetical protein